jgi:hypothetical protein
MERTQNVEQNVEKTKVIRRISTPPTVFPLEARLRLSLSSLTPSSPPSLSPLLLSFTLTFYLFLLFPSLSLPPAFSCLCLLWHRIQGVRPARKVIPSLPFFPPQNTHPFFTHAPPLSLLYLPLYAGMHLTTGGYKSVEGGGVECWWVLLAYAVSDKGPMLLCLILVTGRSFEKKTMRFLLLLTID